MSDDGAERQTILIVDDDADVGYALSAGLERAGRRIIVCRDVESAQLVVERERVTHVISDIKLTGSFRFEGLDFLEHARRHAPAAHVILMSGDASPAVAEEARQRGAVTLLRKPFDLDVLDALLVEPGGSEKATLSNVPTLDEIIGSPELCPAFQAIVRLADDSPFGFESLARFHIPSVVQPPDAMFAYAERKRRVADLELACISRTMDEAKRLPRASHIFINIHPAALADPRFSVSLEAAIEEHRIAPERIVFELTEQQPLRDEPRAFSTIEQLRERGVRFAFDDVGVAYSHLPFIERIRPAYLKISNDFGTGFERESMRTKIVRNLVGLAGEFACEVVLEGIETRDTRDAAREMGIAFGQGYYFGRPMPAAEHA
jgi:EAL domain-containing protein (putative c-di-GMP-specific phosphodiesterase class I)/ActR/RegA family two-component response regulator